MSSHIGLGKKVILPKLLYWFRKVAPYVHSLQTKMLKASLKTPLLSSYLHFNSHFPEKAGLASTDCFFAPIVKEDTVFFLYLHIKATFG